MSGLAIGFLIASVILIGLAAVLAFVRSLMPDCDQ